MFFPLRKSTSVLSIGAVLATMTAGLPQPSLAQTIGKTFSCELVNGSPLTVVKTDRGSIPMIHWVRSFGGRYSDLTARCNEVSNRLDRFNRSGQLGYIRTGNINTYPVLCVDRGVSGNTCPRANVLVTLPKGTNSGLMLQQMLDLRARASGRIIQLSGNQQLVRYRNGDAYVNVDRLLGQITSSQRHK